MTKVRNKLGRGPHAISIAIVSMHAGFEHPRTKYMLAPGLAFLTLSNLEEIKF